LSHVTLFGLHLTLKEQLTTAKFVSAMNSLHNQSVNAVVVDYDAFNPHDIEKTDNYTPPFASV